LSPPLNLGITTYVNGSPMNPIQFDTSIVATDTIAYVATDSAGLTSTSTRTVIVGPDSAESPTGVIIQAAPSIVPRPPPQRPPRRQHNSNRALSAQEVQQLYLMGKGHFRYIALLVRSADSSDPLLRSCSFFQAAAAASAASISIMSAAISRAVWTVASLSSANGTFARPRSASTR
jgi:hypothetical protein